jgi:hypothetical protein
LIGRFVIDILLHVLKELPFVKGWWYMEAIELCLVRIICAIPIDTAGAGRATRAICTIAVGFMGLVLCTLKGASSK